MVLCALGAFIGMGATGEIVVALAPDVLPREATAIPFMAAHQTSWLLRSWMLGSNAINIVCAILLIRSAIRIRRGDIRGWRQMRAATVTLAVIAFAGILVCLPYLLPLPAAPLRAPSLFMLASVVGAGAGLATLCLVLSRVARNKIVPHSNAASRTPSP